jgi:hypothetical protein
MRLPSGEIDSDANSGSLKQVAVSINAVRWSIAVKGCSYRRDTADRTPCRRRTLKRSERVTAATSSGWAVPERHRPR